MADSDDELDVLLAHGRLSAPDRDRVFERVLSTVPRRRRRWLAGASALAAAAFVLVAMFVGRDGFRPRGEAAPVLEIACRAEPGERCPAGEMLLFRASGVSRAAWLAAYAEPVGGGERIWYFPTANGWAPSLDAGAKPQVLPEGVRLGAAGKYDVKLFLFAAPPTRPMVLGETPLAASTQRLEVTP